MVYGLGWSSPPLRTVEVPEPEREPRTVPQPDRQPQEIEEPDPVPVGAP
jgi:hypothetical protein